MGGVEPAAKVVGRGTIPPAVVAVPIRALQGERKKGGGETISTVRSDCAPTATTYKDAIGETGRTPPAAGRVAVAAGAVVLERAVVVAWRGTKARGATWAWPGAWTKWARTEVERRRVVPAARRELGKTIVE